MTTPSPGPGASEATPNSVPAEGAALDAYSLVVTRVAEALLPSVASLRVGADGWAKGSGSAVAISDDGFLVTSAHVVTGALLFVTAVVLAIRAHRVSALPPAYASPEPLAQPA